MSRYFVQNFKMLKLSKSILFFFFFWLPVVLRNPKQLHRPTSVNQIHTSLLYHMHQIRIMMRCINEQIRRLLNEASCNIGITSHRGADKSLARPGRIKSARDKILMCRGLD